MRLAGSQSDPAALRLLFALGGESRLARLVQRDAVGGDLFRALAILEAEVPDLDLLCRRVLADRRPTLRQLGEELGVSAERVRQREKRAREAIADQLQIEGSPVWTAVTELRSRFGSLARLRELEEVMAALASQADAPASSVHRRALLLYLTGHEVCGEWVQSVGLDRRTASLLETLTEDGPVELERCCRELERLGVEESLRRPWLASRPGFLLVGGQVVRESQVADVAIAILREALEPLDLHELFKRTESPASFESFRSHIQHDERFVRRGVRRYGLSEWGGNPYSTLAEEMTGEIERNGGAMPLDDLVGEMAERFGVAEGSVLHRARAPQFEVDPAGTISRRVAPLVSPPKPLALTHNCFRLEAGWAMKVRITPGLLRGATVNMPLAFARSIGLQFGTSCTVASPTGSLRAYWPRYAVSAAYLS
ncbi:MAG TPA: sigma factor-like helix-turn-helix DNA-binding protein, partial [Solirubrobacterales bacterium]|nr:sigma factor-like helix-turn-helix DNA-binding protein [Solirubrobacterales bacterium]